jgi:ATP-binding cassette, subfamily B, bacterial HlyB/CyaB
MIKNIPISIDHPKILQWYGLQGISDITTSALKERTARGDFTLGDELYCAYSKAYSEFQDSELALFYVIEGALRIVIYDPDQAHEISIAILHPGSVFGSLSILSSISSTTEYATSLQSLNYRLIAATNSRVEYLSADLVKLISQESDIVKDNLKEALRSNWEKWGHRWRDKQEKLNRADSIDSDPLIDPLAANNSSQLQRIPRHFKKKPFDRSNPTKFPHRSALKSGQHPSLDSHQLVKKSTSITQETSAMNVIAFPSSGRISLRRATRWRGMPFIEQQSVTDCGATCLAMVTQYWGRRYGLPQLREICHVGRSGATLQHLAKASESLGFQARPLRASWSHMARVRSPWIAHWDGEHYVVVYPSMKWGQRKICIADPASGRQQLSEAEFLRHWTGFGLLLEPTPQFYQQKQEKAQSLQRFGGLLLRESGLLWQIIGITLLAQMFSLISPIFTQIILDDIVVHRSLEALHVFAIGALMFGLGRVALTSVRQYLLDYFANRLDLTLMSGFMHHALRLPLKFFEDRHVGDIITRIQENSKIQQFLVRQAVSVWLDAAMAIVYIGLMFYYNAQLAMLVLAMIPPFAILTLIATPFMKNLSRSLFKADSEETSLAVEMMSGIATVKATASEQELRWRWEEKLVNVLNQRFRFQKLANNVNLVGGGINAIATTGLLWYGAFLVIQGQLTVGQFVAFNMLIGNVISPMLGVINVWDEFQEVLIAIERLNDIFAATPEDTQLVKRSSSNPTQDDDNLPWVPQLTLPPIDGEVCFDRVTFAYDGFEDHPTLSGISFTVTPGQTVAIVGRSGSGKSTLVKLLQGLYHPTKGRILIDSHDIAHVSPQSVRSQLGVVPQDCFLFSGSIAENIQLYRPDYGLDDVVASAKLAEAHAFIQEMPLGYQTKVGERGANLSGGQRQRVAIARALLGDPAMLILDEATSALDTESERRFQQNLERISRDRTTFIIAHRLSTVQRADLILVLDRGLLVEQGTHAELLDQRGLYAHLAQQQLVG